MIGFFVLMVVQIKITQEFKLDRFLTRLWVICKHCEQVYYWLKFLKKRV